MFCPRCGTNLPENSEFCSNCGNRIKQQVVVSTNENNKKKLDKKTILIIIGIAIALLVLVISLFLILKPKNKTTKEEFTTNSSYDQITTAKDENGRTKYIGGKFTDVNVKDESSAYEALNSLKDVLKFNNVKEEFTTESIDTSKDITYYRFHQKYKEVEVYGTNLIISVDKYGNVLSMNGYYIPNININTNPSKSKEEAEEIAKNKIGGENISVVSTYKYIYEISNNIKLVYNVTVHNDNKIIQCMIDANSGEILYSGDPTNYNSYDFEGNSYDGLVKVTIDEFKDVDNDPYKTQYRLYDPNRNISVVDYTGVNMIVAASIGTLKTDGKGVLGAAAKILEKDTMTGTISGNDFIYKSNEDTDKEIVKEGITALKKFETIYDYYNNVLGRKSFDSNGAPIIVNIGVGQNSKEYDEEHKDDEGIHVQIFTKTKYKNATWSPDAQGFYIGAWNDQSLTKSLDVLGHEFTHAVISYTAKLAKVPKDINKANEQGALNEGIADIIGSAIEGKDWTMNEAIAVVRDAQDPLKYEYPVEVGGKYYYPDGEINESKTLEQVLAGYKVNSVIDYDNGGEHQNSPVVSHSAYLMYKNGVFNSFDDVASLWYNSLFLMNSYSNFEDCALAVIQTAKNLGYPEDKVKIIEDAFIETKMLEGKEVELSGTVSSLGETVSDASITITSTKDSSIKYTIKSDEDGEFKQKLKKGTYEIVVKKDGYNEFKEQINITGDTNLDIELSKTIKVNVNREMCKTNNCHTFIIWQMTGDENKFEEEKYIYLVDHGTVIGTDFIVKSINQAFGQDFLKSDGETFVMSMGGMDIDYGWYYRNTDTKFNFNQPITKDVEVELKMLDGMIDYSSLKKINDIFNK